jgi:hypothetical protein
MQHTMEEAAASAATVVATGATVEAVERAAADWVAAAGAVVDRGLVHTGEQRGWG